jgi:sugar O-acyltransferase (sialic acid O-acetyltransferase NeuD family)
VTVGVVAVVGAGAFGQQLVRMYLGAGAQVEEAVLFDDTVLDGDWNHLCAHSVLPFDRFRDCHLPIDCALVGLGYKHLKLRNQIVAELAVKGVRLPNVVAGSAIVAHEFDSTERGIVLFPGAVLDSGVSLGRGAVVNAGAVIAHDTALGDCVFVGPGATVCGGVTVERETFIGAGAVIMNGLTIGANSIIAMGSRVQGSTDPGAQMAGSPARPVSNVRLT